MNPPISSRLRVEVGRLTQQVYYSSEHGHERANDRTILRQGRSPTTRARKLGGEERQYSRPRSDMEIELTPEQRAERAARARARRAARKLLDGKA